jgi:endonuclease YncB( thermonuclease family)
MARYFVLAFLLLVFLSANAEAATLFGRVIEVNDGDVITVFNLNRPVRIRLMAIDAPEASQPFGDVARKHLSDLVYDKNVLVEYWGIAADGSLVGRVTLNSVDVGVQMIRDGAAWFDASNQAHLTASDRDVYQHSEQAARTERRGLWQAENPIAPWEFVRAQSLRRNPAASLNAILPAATAKASHPVAELTNLTLLGARVTPVSATEKTPEDLRARWTPGGPPANWQRLKPVTANFSALVPEGGVHAKLPSSFQDGTIDVYLARDGGAVYALAWLNAPSFGESDERVLDGSLHALMQGVGESYEARHLSAFSCELQNEHRFSSNGFSVSEYDLPSCTIPTKIRAFTRVTNGVRQLYIGLIFNPEDDPNTTRFMNSFTVNSATPKAKRSAKKSSH